MDLVRYHTKLTNFTTREKNRIQNCLTVSNWELKSAFGDVFNRASSNIIGHILANPSKKLSDVSALRTKHMKATDDEILGAIDGETCPEQAEKLRIIRAHINGLDVCKANLQSLNLSTAPKHITEIDLVCTVSGMATFSSISVIGEIGIEMSGFPHQSIFVLGWVQCVECNPLQSKSRNHRQIQ